MQEGKPAETSLLIGPELTRKSFGGGEWVWRFLLVVLLQHGLQARTGVKLMHGQAHHRVAFGGGESKRVVEAEVWIGGAKALGIF